MKNREKVDRLIEIFEKKIAVLCSNEEENLDIINLIGISLDNFLLKENFSEKDLKKEMAYRICGGVYKYKCASKYYFEDKDYKVIPYVEFFSDEAKEINESLKLLHSEKEKPIEEWTLKEAKDFCIEKHKCKNCNLEKLKICGNSPDNWVLQEVITEPASKGLLTAEVDLLKAIKLLGGESSNLTLKYNEEEKIFYVNGKNVYSLKRHNFPSLLLDKEYSVDELLEEVENSKEDIVGNLRERFRVDGNLRKRFRVDGHQ